MNRAAVLLALALAAAPLAAGAGPRLVIEVDGQAQGAVVIELDDVHAPNHAARIVALAEAGAYDNVVFHRVLEGFMAQTGDVEFGQRDGGLAMAGFGGSDLPDLAAEFSDIPFGTGSVGMARAARPDSANSQFFITFAPAPHLNGQFTVVGQVVEGQDVVNAIRRGDEWPNANGELPDWMARVTVER